MPPFDPSLKTIAIFGHPNHEIAVFGMLARLKPPIIYLTDGGGEKRVAQTRQALASIGCLERAVFLNHSEASFYEAMLRGDADFFAGIAGQLAEAIEYPLPQQIVCDAVEFYNPVHDITVPIVLCAAKRIAGARIFEVPLIYQDDRPGEHYVLQNVPIGQQKGRTVTRLNDAELAAKMHARNTIYTMLGAQMGPLLLDAPAEGFRNETLFPSPTPMAAPGDGRVLRYEWRGRKLADEGSVGEVITYAGHFLPVCASIATMAARAPVAN